jgi:hypothetical protein
MYETSSAKKYVCNIGNARTGQEYSSCLGCVTYRERIYSVVASAYLQLEKTTRFQNLGLALIEKSR